MKHNRLIVTFGILFSITVSYLLINEAPVNSQIPEPPPGTEEAFAFPQGWVLDGPYEKGNFRCVIKDVTLNCSLHGDFFYRGEKWKVLYMLYAESRMICLITACGVFEDRQNELARRKNLNERIT